MVEQIVSINRFNAIDEKQSEGKERKSVFVDQNFNGV